MTRAKLQYKLPSREDEAAAIKTMDPDKVGKLRDEIKFRLEGLLSSCDDYFDNLIESDCFVCDKTGYAYFDIPEGWGWLSSGHLLCKDCVSRWTERFGAPEINRKGEVVYEQDSIVSEDSTHRRQATFEFI